ncbi:MAG: chitinase [Phenylobacterium sp.]|jgi:chitinase
MNNKLSRVAIAVGLVAGFSSLSASAAPGIAAIEWMESNFAIVDVAESGTSYKSVVTRKDFAEVPVAWSKWNGENGTKVEYLLNGEVVLTQTASAGSGTQTGSATLQVAKGGQYDLQIRLCDDAGVCTASVSKAIKVEDTDGTH